MERRCIPDAPLSWSVFGDQVEEQVRQREEQERLRRKEKDQVGRAHLKLGVVNARLSSLPGRCVVD